MTFESPPARPTITEREFLERILAFVNGPYWFESVILPPTSLLVTPEPPVVEPPVPRAAGCWLIEPPTSLLATPAPSPPSLRSKIATYVETWPEDSTHDLDKREAELLEIVEEYWRGFVRSVAAYGNRVVGFVTHAEVDAFFEDHSIFAKERLKRAVARALGMRESFFSGTVDHDVRVMIDGLRSRPVM